MDNKIEIRGLTKSFNSVTVLDSVDLDIPRGEITVFVGPSGCGKTTMMRCIVGFETPENGSILIDGKDMAGVMPKDRDIAMVFQYYSLYPNMTVRKNMSVALELTTNFSKAEINDRVEEMARVLNLTHLLERRPAQLSGGEAQRVSIGRALIRNASMVFLDEPLSAVDAKLRRELRSEIRRILKQFGVTAIYVTHDQEEAMAIADNMVLLGDGHILGVGAPEMLYRHPTSVSAARLLGRPPINLFSMHFQTEGEEWALRCNGMKITLPENYARKHLSRFTNRVVTVGIRPSDFVLSEDEKTAAGCGKIVSVENLGDEINLFVSCCAEEFAIHLAPEDIHKGSEVVWFTVATENLQLFDPESGESLLWLDMNKTISDESEAEA